MGFKMSADKIQLFSYFATLSAAGAFLLQIPAAYVSGVPVPFVNSLFTSVSAVCVTGLSSVDMSVYTTAGLAIIMLLIEMGGLGIITFISMYLALPSKKVSLVNRRVVREFFIDEVETNPKTILKNIILFTGIIQLCGAVCLFLAFQSLNVESPVFTSLFLSVSAFCNAGFSPYQNSLADFAAVPAVNIVIMLLIISGGLGFIVLKNVYQTALHRRKRLSLHSKIVLWTTGALIVCGALFFFIADFNSAFKELSVPEKILASFYQSVTARTAGFETLPQKNFSPASQIISDMLMFIGGSPGSMSGGIKTTTFFVILLFSVKGDMTRRRLVLFNRRIDSPTIERAMGILSKSLFFIFVSLTVLLFTEKELVTSGIFGIGDLFFEVVSAFATVGLSQGVTPFLSDAGKIVVIATMFVGRTGFFAMVLRSPGYE